MSATPNINLLKIKGNKLDATSEPSATDDSSNGYQVGSTWIDVTNNIAYTCVDSTTNAALWNKSGFAQTLNKTLTLQKPEVGDDITVFRTDVAITVQEVIAVSTGTGTPTTTYNLRYSTDRSVIGTALVSAATTTSTTSGNTATIANTTIPADSFIWLEVSAIGGTDVYLTIDIRYTE